MQSTLNVSTITGIATTILLAVSGWFISATGAVGGEVKEIRADVSAKGERISSLETSVQSIGKDIDSINKKLDTLINYQTALKR